MPQPQLDAWHMSRALELAAAGRGYVEPNPLVGCVIAQGAEIIGEGWHRRFGGPHAEIEALAVAGSRSAGTTLYVNLEPCCHHGKTPPCTEAVIAAGVRRVVIAHQDPFPPVAGRGVAQLQAAGIEVCDGVGQDKALSLNAPYLKLLRTHRPWVIAKWAMTADGKIASRSGDSRWISSEASRQVVHELRGRVDAILVGRGTVQADDPLLTARPPGPRVATRVVLDTGASLSSQSRLAQSARDVPVLVAVGARSSEVDRQRLRELGCEVYVSEGTTHGERVGALLAESGRRRMTNVLVEGGARVLGTLLDAGEIDEVHVFIAPVLLGGATAPGAIAGEGRASIAEALRLHDAKWRPLAADIYLHARVRR